MGGGVGVSIHGRFRVCTERVLFAKPETKIGLFPDVGASHFLAAMPGSTGEYIGLTGARLKHPDLIYAGLATHFVTSVHLGNLLKDLSSVPSSGDRGASVAAVLDKYQALSPPIAVADSHLAQHRQAIDQCFGAPNCEAILEQLALLEQSGGMHAAFAAQVCVCVCV